MMDGRFEKLLANDEAMKTWAVGHEYVVEWDSPEAVEAFRQSTWRRHVEWKREVARELEAMMTEDA